jgi:hypothetical protein
LQRVLISMTQGLDPDDFSWTLYRHLCSGLESSVFPGHLKFCSGSTHFFFEFGAGSVIVVGNFDILLQNILCAGEIAVSLVKNCVHI